jgi:integrase
MPGRNPRNDLLAGGLPRPDQTGLPSPRRCRRVYTIRRLLRRILRVAPSRSDIIPSGANAARPRGRSAKSPSAARYSSTIACLASRPAGLDAACGQPGTWLRQPECRQGIAPEQGAQGRAAPEGEAKGRSVGEIRTTISHVQGRWRPLFLTAIFCGLRASELRGLRWQDVDLSKGELHLRQRADRYHKIGPPKSEAGERTVPVPPSVLNALREWKLKCPKGKFGLVFANLSGNIDSHGNITLVGSSRYKSRRVSLWMARRNTPAFIRCDISSRPGASTGGRTVG